MKLAIVAATLWAAGSAGAQAGTSPPERVLDDRSPPVSRVWITGASNIRRFTCRATSLTGQIELSANAARRSVMSGENLSNAPSLRVPVAQLRCGVSAMHRHLRETLHEATYESIEFHLDSYDVRLDGETQRVRIAGRLRIAGTERPVLVSAAISADTLGRMHVRGAHTVRMSEFGVQPPRRFGGLLRVGDRIVVHFDIVPDRGRGAVDIVYGSSPVLPGGSHASDF